MPRPIATALDELVPAAAYEGSLTDDDQAAFDALVWHDKRAKPSWSEVVSQAEQNAPEQSRYASGYVLARALKTIANGDSTKVSPFDLAYIGGRRLVPETAESMARITGKMGSTSKAAFDLALGVSQ